MVAESGAYPGLMHMLGEPRTMQVGPRYDDVVSEVVAFLEERLQFAVDAGVSEDRICLDPGFGFGKTVEHNFELLRRLDEIVALGRRSSSASRASARSVDPRRPRGDDRTVVGEPRCCRDGLRQRSDDPALHDVRETVEALTVAEAAS